MGTDPSPSDPHTRELVSRMDRGRGGRGGSHGSGDTDLRRACASEAEGVSEGSEAKQETRGAALKFWLSGGCGILYSYFFCGSTFSIPTNGLYLCSMTFYDFCFCYNIINSDLRTYNCTRVHSYGRLANVSIIAARMTGVDRIQFGSACT
jgi:hypothetical protein